jgi:hypothetical protein
MATCLEKLIKANRWRIRVGTMASQDTDGWNGQFLCPFDGDLWLVQISDGEGWRHLSISNAQRRVLPSWQIMCRVKEAFWGDEEWVCQFHPAKSDYINDAPFCLHLWQPLNEELPRPSFALV